MNIRDTKVLLVAALPPPPGGDSTWAEEYIKYSETHHYSVEVVNTSVIGKRSENVNDTFFLLDEIKRSIGIWVGIRQALKQYRPSVVHMNSNCSPVGLIRDYISSCIVKANKVPLVVHCHTNVGFKLKNSKFGNFFLYRFLNNAQKVIVLNKKSYQYIDGKINTYATIIPNFIDKDYIRKEEKEIHDDIRNIVYIGHVKREKGIDELIKVAHHFKDITFHIVGPVTEHYHNYVPEPNIIMTGAVSPVEVRNYLMDSDLFLFPTYSEGFSVALLEAMASGIPVVATDVGANSDMLEANGGIIVEPMNTDMIIQAIEKMRNKNIRQKMSGWNINKVRNFYSIDTIMKQLRELYNDVLTVGKI